MRAAQEDRLESGSRRGGFPTRHLLLLLGIIAVVAVLWQTIDEQVGEVTPEPVVTETVSIEPRPLPPAEDIPPRPEPVVADAPVEAPVEALPQLPTLAESDEMLREQLTAVGMGPELDRLDQEQNLIQQGVAMIDGFSRGLVLRKLLPLTPPASAFTVVEQGGQTFMSQAGYERYNGYTEAFASLDTGLLVDNFHLMRPLYEEAYGQLGLNPDDFDNAVIRMLDRILSTPEIEDPIALTRKSVMYRYADPQLEALTAVQKQLLRMGPDNIRRIKEQARALRAGLLSQP